jgi:hypothetical protein
MNGERIKINSQVQNPVVKLIQKGEVPTPTVTARSKPPEQTVYNKAKYK